jgi:hypothetical protein
MTGRSEKRFFHNRLWGRRANLMRLRMYGGEGWLVYSLSGGHVS